MKKINKKELHEIFQNLRKKEQNAYNKLYENYYKLIYGIVFSIIKNKDDSEDITHEIFTKIYKLDVSKLPTNNESSWLFTVSKNECYLYLRKVKPNIDIDEIYEIPESSNYIDKIIDIEYYNKLIKDLNEDEKLIVSLKVLSNFTFSKISQIMNIPIGTVQWKYYKAINSLKISVSSLVGAIVSFIIVLARRKKLYNKQYLNSNENFDFEQDEENYNNINDESINDNVLPEQNNNISNNMNIEQNESSEKNEDIEENVNVENIQNVQGNESVQNDKIEINDVTDDFSKNEEIYNTSTIEPEVKINKIDTVQILCTTIGLVFLMIFIIFLKIYQQKLRKKASK